MARTRNKDICGPKCGPRFRRFDVPEGEQQGDGVSRRAWRSRTRTDRNSAQEMSIRRHESESADDGTAASAAHRAIRTSSLVILRWLKDWLVRLPFLSSTSHFLPSSTRGRFPFLHSNCEKESLGTGDGSNDTAQMPLHYNSGSLVSRQVGGGRQKQAGHRDWSP